MQNRPHTRAWPTCTGPSAGPASEPGARLRRWRLTGLIVGILLCTAILLSPAPPGLSPEAKGALAIFALCFVLWVTGALPLSVTSILAIVLLPTFRVIPAARSFALFGSSAVFFILGAFIMAAAMMKSGLSTRLALAFLRRFDSGPRSLLAGVICAGGFLAFWMPEHVVAALMFPIVLEIARALELEPGRSRYGRALFLALAWGAVVGGVATFLGGARNPLALGILRDHYDVTIGFLDWMVAVAPLSIILLACVFVLLTRFFPADVTDVTRASDVLSEKTAALGPMSIREKGIAAIVVLTIVAWVVAGRGFDMASISLLAAVAMFALDLIDWQSVEEYVNWGVILMYGGAIAIAAALHETGAALWIADVGMARVGTLPPFWMLMVFAIVATFLTEAISNVATVALLLPICFGVAEGAGIPPVLVVYAVAVPAGLAFGLPMGSPPNAIAYSAGYFRIKHAVGVGAILKIIAIAVFAAAVLFYWPALGLAP